jgi:hypothetical protein
VKRVDFFVVGAQKAGSTALDHMLRHVSGIEMAATKELHFFDREDIDWQAPPYQELHRHFDLSRPDVLRGETTPSYMYWPAALKRIRDYHPGARLVAVLRHPVYRAYSQWKMQVVRGFETLSFGEAMSPAGRLRLASGDASARRFSYIERGLYRQQVETMFDLFPREQCLIVTSDQLRGAPHDTLERVCRFLGARQGAAGLADPGYVVAVDSRAVAEIDPSAAAGYLDIFREDIVATARRTGLDLTDWLSPSYREHPVEAAAQPSKL